ncbi:Hypothetical protein, putative [Bodo saltans]|uniref:Uncharacterized protein n=1 Tax=Bodo saltans TaxID=75058 RepID=A0A0S4IJZ8_BODSA|nr:Hypothetical protein, putative [Bodo saltans]|eukprot:CUE98336.1 Hypothetical protein, putative [Bodo saltans]
MVRQSIGTTFERKLKPFMTRRLAGELEDFSLGTGSGVLRWEEGALAADPDAPLLAPSLAEVPRDGGATASPRFSSRLFPVPSVFGGVKKQREMVRQSIGTTFERKLKPFMTRRLAGELEDFSLGTGSGVLRWEEGALAADPDAPLLAPSLAEVPRDGGATASPRFSSRLFPVPSVFGGVGAPDMKGDSSHMTWNVRFNFPGAFEFETTSPSFRSTMMISRKDTASIATAVLASLHDVKATHSLWVDDTSWTVMNGRWKSYLNGGGRLWAPFTFEGHLGGGLQQLEFEVDHKTYLARHITGPNGALLHRVTIPELQSLDDLKRFFSHSSRLWVLDKSRRVRVREAAKALARRGTAATQQQGAMSSSLLDIDMLSDHSNAPLVPMDMM